MKAQLLSIIALFAITACETVVDVDIPLETPKLVVNCIYTPDSSWSATVSRSKHILDDGEFKFFKDASVKLTDTGNGEVSTFDMREGEYENFNQYFLKGTVKYDTKYLLEVSKDGFETAKAEMSIPSPVEIGEIKIDTSVYDEFNRRKFSVSLKFKDPGGENFYGVRTTFTYVDEYYNYDTEEMQTDTFENLAYLETNDPIVEDFMDNDEMLIFNDKTFENKTYTFAYEISYFYSRVTSIKVELLSLSPEYYNYHRTLSLQDYTDGDPFAEPVNVYNNIENGYGVFGGYSQNEKRMDL